MRSSVQQEAELPVTSCHRLGRFAGPVCVHTLLPQYPYPKKPKKLYRKSVKTNADEVLSLNNLRDFIFETSMVAIQIDPEGSPVPSYGKQKSVRLHCVQQKYSQFSTQSLSQGMEAQLDFFQGTGLDGAKVILNRCTYRYIYKYMCNYKEGFFYIIQFHWETP